MPLTCEDDASEFHDRLTGQDWASSTRELAVAAVAALMLITPMPANAATVDYGVDGDTIRLSSACTCG